MRASKSVLPLALSGRFEEALEYAALMWEGRERAGRPAARWTAPAAHAAAPAEGLRDSGGREYPAMAGTGPRPGHALGPARPRGELRRLRRHQGRPAHGAGG
ncbi:hypothetical protein ACFC1B_04940 [Streptomyces xiamenensis]|uniref:hypothetical protein n=1 Tax=Streptomyces xiamenensis TaxID=408015 RepID=UPI0035DD4C24